MQQSDRFLMDLDVLTPFDPPLYEVERGKHLIFNALRPLSNF